MSNLAGENTDLNRQNADLNRRLRDAVNKAERKEAVCRWRYLRASCFVYLNVLTSTTMCACVRVRVCVCVRACVCVYQELEALERRTSALFAVEVRAREAEELNDTLLASLARIEERFQVQVRRATNE